MPGFVSWFSGLSGSGKSTRAALVSAALHRRAVHFDVRVAGLLASATWPGHVGARSSRLGLTGPTTSTDPLAPLVSDEHIGGFVSVRSKRYGEPPPVDERCHEVRPEVAASGGWAT